MLFKIDYFDKLPETYQKVVKKLSDDLTLKKKLKSKRKLLEDFRQKYSMIPPIWFYWFQ